MSLNFDGLNLNNTFNSGIVQGTELENISKGFFTSTQQTSKVQQTKTDLSANLNKFQATNRGINLFEKGVDINLTKQVASNKSGLNVQLSQNAMTNIQALNAQAAKLQANSIQSNMHKHVEGKLHVQTETEAMNNDLKSIFSMPSTTKMLNTMSLDKDRKGSNSFLYSNQEPSSSEGEPERLSIVA